MEKSQYGSAPVSTGSFLPSDIKYPVSDQSNVLALNTHFVTNQPLTLIMKGEYLSRNVLFKTPDGQAIFETDYESFSASRRDHLIDCKTKSEIFTIRRRTWGRGFRHYAELPPEGSGNMIFETVTQKRFLKGSITKLNFGNAANNGVHEELEMHEQTFGQDADILYHNKVVGTIRKYGLHLRPEYTLEISAGIDPLFLVVFALIKLERARAQSSAAAAGGGAAASC